MDQRAMVTDAVYADFGISLRDFPKSLKILLCNPAFIFLSFAVSSEGMIIQSLAAFLPKIIESQFSISASAAALYVGLVSVPGVGIGNMLGGYLVKKLKLKCSGIIRLCLSVTVLSTCFVLAFALQCENANFDGLNYDIDRNTSAIFLKTCNADCGCSEVNFDPVCGIDNVVYYSPCFAGCKAVHSTGEAKVYQNCSCVEGTGLNMTISNQTITYQASREKCSRGCSTLNFFLLLAFLYIFLAFMVVIPALSAVLRCVAESQKSFALGIHWAFVRILGTIPAPIVLGFLIDMSCVHWPKLCKGLGACALYDNYSMNLNILIFVLSFKLCTIISFLAAWYLYKPPENSA